MAEHDLNICLSEIDEDRFGMKTAKALVSSVSDVREAMGFCKSHQVELLIARCPVTGLEAAQEMERQGFSLMDTLIYFSHDLKKIPIPEEIPGVIIRREEPGEELLVKEVAGESFRGYLGHYHADPRLLREECNETYRDWAYRACLSPKRTGEVFVAESDGRIIGFGTMKINDEKEGEGGLFGVAHAFRGRGVYRSIMIRCLNWCVGKELGKMVISTQITNPASQKTWVRLGFEQTHSFYTFHKWFEPLAEGNPLQP